MTLGDHAAPSPYMNPGGNNIIFSVYHSSLLCVMSFIMYNWYLIGEKTYYYAKNLNIQFLIVWHYLNMSHI